MARSKHIVFGATHDNEELGQSEDKDQFINVGKNFRNQVNLLSLRSVVELSNY